VLVAWLLRAAVKRLDEGVLPPGLLGRDVGEQIQRRRLRLLLAARRAARAARLCGGAPASSLT
jgi:hypothetical protein